MRIACLQHEDVTGPCAIVPWAEARGHDLRIVRADLGDALPTGGDADLVIVLGGTMNVPDVPELPWLGDVHEWLAGIVERDELPVLGICLGAQLLASVLGAEVGPIDEPELGWMSLAKTDAGRAHPLLAGVPDTFEAFQSHGQGFAVPAVATSLVGGPAWPGQAFVHGTRVLAVQFHPEFHAPAIRNIAARPTAWRGPWVSAPEAMLDRLDARLEVQHRILAALLDALVATAVPQPA